MQYDERAARPGSLSDHGSSKWPMQRKTVEAMGAGVRAHMHFLAHQRTWALLPTCGAKTRNGRPCLDPVMRGKSRCRLHGGAEGSGAQRGNQNRLVHGRYTRDALEQRALVRLVEAADVALMADLSIVDVVARGAVKEYDAAVRHAGAQHQRVCQAANGLARLLIASGRGEEARALAAEVAELMAMEHTASNGAA